MLIQYDGVHTCIYDVYNMCITKKSPITSSRSKCHRVQVFTLEPLTSNWCRTMWNSHVKAPKLDGMSIHVTSNISTVILVQYVKTMAKHGPHSSPQSGQPLSLRFRKACGIVSSTALQTKDRVQAVSG